MKNDIVREPSHQEGGSLQEKVLSIKRCVTVRKGGRRFSFSALVIVGDGNGRVGLGFGKANEVVDAIKKAVDDAHKNLVTIHFDGVTIAYDVHANFCGSRVLIKSARKGTGIVAGSHVRSILELVGIKDVVAKNLRGSNPCNQVRAAFEALAKLKNREDLLAKRGALL